MRAVAARTRSVGLSHGIGVVGVSLCQRLPRHAPLHAPGHAQMLSCFPAAVCRVLTRTRVSAARGRVRGVFSKLVFVRPAFACGRSGRPRASGRRVRPE